ncbi:hypothetical protein B9479_004350 [Cryptococcus floricola]|uniref:AB hydrolase-1 domain-containing protein n=1 Tax=Cryptococcus floricola TaxID=2591691 RepID=A0A5D3AW16_9TREE|nr:hypothetical protein B9479_004350 [Cryptococcus floricola]
MSPINMFAISLAPRQPYTLSYHLSTPSNKVAETIDPAYPTILFCHPPWIDGYIFYPQFEEPELHENYNLLAIDLPAHGSSHVDSTPAARYEWHRAAETIYFALEALNVAPVHVVGVGSGCLSALRLVLAHPEACESLALVGPLTEHEPVAVDEAFKEWIDSLKAAVAEKDKEAIHALNKFSIEFLTDQEGNPVIADLAEEYGQMVEARLDSGEMEFALPYYCDLLEARNELPTQEEMEQLLCPLLVIEQSFIENPTPPANIYTKAIDAINARKFREGRVCSASRLMIEGTAPSRWMSLAYQDPVNLALAEFISTKTTLSLPPSPASPSVARRPSTPRDITGFFIPPPPKLAPGRKTLGEMMDELEKRGEGVNVEVEVLVQIGE